jgi:hypothetical protein
VFEAVPVALPRRAPPVDAVFQAFIFKEGGGGIGAIGHDLGIWSSGRGQSFRPRSSVEVDAAVVAVDLAVFVRAVDVVARVQVSRCRSLNVK